MEFITGIELKEFEILKEQEGKDASLVFLNSKTQDLKFKSAKVYFDLANIYKSYKKYYKSIENFNIALKKLKKNLIHMLIFFTEEEATKEWGTTKKLMRIYYCL